MRAGINREESELPSGLRFKKLQVKITVSVNVRGCQQSAVGGRRHLSRNALQNDRLRHRSQIRGDGPHIGPVLIQEPAVFGAATADQNASVTQKVDAKLIVYMFQWPRAFSTR